MRSFAALRMTEVGVGDILRVTASLDTSNEVSDGLEEFGVLFSHEPMATFLEDHLLGARDGLHDLIGRVRRRYPVMTPREDEGRSSDSGKPGSYVVGLPVVREEPVQHVDIGDRLEAAGRRPLRVVFIEGREGGEDVIQIHGGSDRPAPEARQRLALLRRCDVMQAGKTPLEGFVAGRRRAIGRLRR